RTRHVKPSDEELRRLPYKNALVYGRLSSQGQVQDSHESLREIADLVTLAIKDGYLTNLTSSNIKDGLIRIQQGMQESGVWQDGQVTVDVRDLGLSGSLTVDNRPGMASLMKTIKDGRTGAVYLTEGVSRLSRDRERISAYSLLKLLTDNSCRIRTPDGIWNPGIKHDWDYLAEEFEDAIDELAMMGKRLSRRRRKKAARGEFVGGPVLPGFILPIVDKEADGRLRYGKLKPYPPHAHIVEKILREFVKQGGSKTKTHHSLGNITFPFFTPEFSYMERHTSLRKATRTESGYLLTPAMIRLLALNPKLIGVWSYGDTEPILDNHEAIVPTELFMEAYELAKYSGKPRGKGISHEPLEWHNLLYCCNHDLPQRITGHPSKGAYRCQSDYLQGRGPSCFDITARCLDEPLTGAILQQLDFTPFAEEVLLELESDISKTDIEAEQQKKEIASLVRRLETLKSYLGDENKDREEFYWEQIEKTRQQLDELRLRPVSVQGIPAANYQLVRHFLKGIKGKWVTYPRTLRNRLIKLLIDHVDIRHEGKSVEATIIWKTGQSQIVNIQRLGVRSNHENRWSIEETKRLRTLWSNSLQEVISTALPGRTWEAIAHKARNNGWKRKQCQSSRVTRRRWRTEDNIKGRELYVAGTPVADIASNLARSQSAILHRAREKGWQRSISDKIIATDSLSIFKKNPKVSNE
ncbi:hypothetical protein ACFLUS_06105, partial [Chloroflexota bacterium]